MFGAIEADRLYVEIASGNGAWIVIRAGAVVSTTGDRSAIPAQVNCQKIKVRQCSLIANSTQSGPSVCNRLINVQHCARFPALLHTVT